MSHGPMIGYEPGTSTAAPCALQSGEEIYFDNIDTERLHKKNYPAVCTELVDSFTWLKRYGLRPNKLTYQNILSMIGFKQQQDYTDPLKKHITSKYGKGLFLKTQTSDGTVYNVTVEASRLADIEFRLGDTLQILQTRLRWLNSESRRLFGVILERNVCLVLDCKQQNKNQLREFKNSVLNLLCEQVIRLDSFNIVRCISDESFEVFQPTACSVNALNIEKAIDWLNHTYDLVDERKFIDTSTCEGVLYAFQDSSLDAVYLLSEGVSSNGLREVMFDKLVKESFNKRIRLNIVSYNCNDLSTVEFLKRVAINSFGPGRFHAYSLLKKLDHFSPGPICLEPTKNNVTVNKLGFGGTPPGSGIKSDVMLIFEEIQEAKEALSNLRIIIKSMNDMTKAQQDAKAAPEPPVLPRKRSYKSDDYITSKEWLSTNGLSARKLDLFETLKSVCFKHTDGVVDIRQEPHSGKLEFFGHGKQYYMGDAIPRETLVNAKYCDKFAHVLWHDGTIAHVHVTPDLHRNYEKRIKIAIEQYEKRINWLSKGSRELFGTVVENNICILIDTSQSMQNSLDFVKEKLKILLKDQLRSKTRFNLVSFNSRVYPWRDRMAEIDESSIQSAVDWINSLDAQGTTNSLAAIRFALNDLNTEAIYMLTDGRPDQDPGQILSQISLNKKIPIHTISFNCTDKEANTFLSELAIETGGRYHYFNEDGRDFNPTGATPYQSEDIYLLKNEIKKATKFLKQVTHLREECAKASLRGNQSNFEVKPRNELIKSGSYKYNDLKIETDSQNSSEDASHTLKDIQSLSWIYPETRMILEKQFMMEQKKSDLDHVNGRSDCTLEQRDSKLKKNGSKLSAKPFKFSKTKKFKYQEKCKPKSPRDDDDKNIQKKIKELASELSANSSDSDKDEDSEGVDMTNRKENIKEKNLGIKSSKENTLARGTKVIARNDVLGYYFAGKIIKSIDSRTYSVKFDNDRVQNEMSIRHIINSNDSAPYLSIGDYVMARVMNEYDDQCWVPGIVQTKLVQMESKSFPKVFTVLYFNGQEGDNCRSELIKINKVTYGTAVNYIRSKLGMGTDLKEEKKEDDKDKQESSEIKPKSPPRQPSPDLNALRGDVLGEIKDYFETLKLDDRYQQMFDEFTKLRKNHKELKKDLLGRLQIIRTDFEEWKATEPKIVKIIEQREPVVEYKHIYHEKHDSSRDKRNVKNKSVKEPKIKETYNEEAYTQKELEHLMKKLRKKLPPLEKHENVLARWPDDGWYYFSTIIECLGDGEYRIEDQIDDTEKIFRENIISEKHQSSYNLEVSEPVIALHPDFEYSYAPGIITEVPNGDENFKIKFYDNVESIVKREEAFSINPTKHKLDISFIDYLENAKIGKKVVARNVESRKYEIGTVRKCLRERGRQYTVEWSNGNSSLVKCHHLFFHNERKPHLGIEDFVLAPKKQFYMPGIVIDKKKSKNSDQTNLTIRFGEDVEKNVDYDKCFWLSKDYYHDAVSFVRSTRNGSSS